MASLLQGHYRSQGEADYNWLCNGPWSVGTQTPPRFTTQHPTQTNAEPTTTVNT